MKTTYFNMSTENPFSALIQEFLYRASVSVTDNSQHAHFMIEVIGRPIIIVPPSRRIIFCEPQRI